MSVIQLELTERQTEIYEEVIKKVDETAIFLAGLSHEERLDWLKAHQYSYRKNSDFCSAHYIRERVIEQLMLEGLQRLMWYIQVYEQKFAQEQMERFCLQEKKELTAKRRELDRAKQRVTEIDCIIQKSYEDLTKGLLTEERFATLTLSLENEQKHLKVSIPEMEASLKATTDKAADLQRFIERTRQVTRLTELRPEIVHEFIEKIVVSQPEKVDGKRHQRVDIYYRTIGLWIAPGRKRWNRNIWPTIRPCRNVRKRRRNRSHAV